MAAKKITFDMEARESIRRGGKNGPIVKLDTVAKRELLLRITSPDKDERMPAEGEQLKRAVEFLRRTIGT